MSMTSVTNGEAKNEDPLSRLMHEDDALVRVDNSAVAVLARSETEAQLDAAHKYPRSVARFMKEAMTLATLTRPIAEACIYALPRSGKIISGPSVRLAEIAASAYGNLHVAARVVDAEEREVVAQGVAWDLEKNLRITVEARRRIINSKGKRYDDDMITMTGNAAASIALRNAIFRVVPRAYIDMIYAKVKEVAVGDAKTLASRRVELMNRLMKIGVPQERILPRVGKTGIEDVGLEEVEQLIGLGTAIASGEKSIDDCFPPLPGTAATTKKLEDELLGKAPPPASAAVQATPAPAAAPPAASLVPPAEPVPHDADGVVVEGEGIPAWLDPKKTPARASVGTPLPR
jgi:hypothetical protein